MIKNKLFELEVPLNTKIKDINENILKSMPDTMIDVNKNIDINDIFGVCDDESNSNYLSEERFLELILNRNLNESDDNDIDIDELIKQQKEKIKKINITMGDLLTKTNVIKNKYNMTNDDLSNKTEEEKAEDHYIYSIFNKLMNEFIIPFEKLSYSK